MAALAACTACTAPDDGGGPTPSPSAAATPAAPGTVEPSAAGGDAAVDAARAALGEPVVTLADAVLAAAAEVDAARHETPRGAAAGDGAAALPGRLEVLRTAALAADDAARDLPAEGRVGRAAGLVSEVSAVALRAADDGAAQAAALERLSAFDVRMDQAVAAWDAPGSQSRRREALAELAQQLDALAAEAAAEQPVPDGCPGPRDARVRWATLLAERSRALGALATGATGDRYDAERAAFGATPFGEDRLAVDAADRPCWEERSVLAAAAAGIRGEVETLEALLR